MEDRRVRLYTVNGKVVSVFDDKNGDRYMINQAGRVTPLPHRLPTPKVTIKDLGAKVSQFTTIFKDCNSPYLPELGKWEGYFNMKEQKSKVKGLEIELGVDRDTIVDEVRKRITCPLRLLYIYDALLD